MRWNYKINLKNLSFCCHFAGSLGKFTVLYTRNTISLTTLCVFITFWLHYHKLIFYSTWFNIKADSENTKNISADQFWFFFNQGCSEAKKSALISAASEKIICYSVLFRADFLAMKKWNFSANSENTQNTFLFFFWYSIAWTEKIRKDHFWIFWEWRFY